MSFSFRKKYEEQEQRRAAIQELLVSRGFDLSGLVSGGQAWDDHVLETGWPKLARLVALGERFPSPKRAIPKF